MSMRVNGQLIKELRIKHSYSQEKLAEIVGVNLRTIQRIETHGAIALSTRRALAQALGVRPEELDVPGEPGEAPPPNEPPGVWPHRRLSALSVILVVLGASILAVSIVKASPIGVVTLPAVVGMIIALAGLVTLARLNSLPGLRVYAVLCIALVSMVMSPPAWTIQALVAISLWAAFELGIVTTRLRPGLRHC